MRSFGPNDTSYLATDTRMDSLRSDPRLATSGGASDYQSDPSCPLRPSAESGFNLASSWMDFG